MDLLSDDSQLTIWSLNGGYRRVRESVQILSSRPIRWGRILLRNLTVGPNMFWYRQLEKKLLLGINTKYWQHIIIKLTCNCSFVHTGKLLNIVLCDLHNSTHPSKHKILNLWQTDWVRGKFIMMQNPEQFFFFLKNGLKQQVLQFLLKASYTK